MRYVLIAFGVLGGLGSLAVTFNTNFYQPPDFKAMTGLAIGSCSAISIIVGLATIDVVNAIEAGRKERARSERAHPSPP